VGWGRSIGSVISRPSSFATALEAVTKLPEPSKLMVKVRNERDRWSFDNMGYPTATRSEAIRRLVEQALSKNR
jgi:hypothetical protein